MHIKSAGAVLDWPITYDLDSGDSIATSDWTVSPVEGGGLAVVDGSDGVDGSQTYCLLSGGIFRHVYTVQNTVTTAQGRTYAQSFVVRIGPMEAA